MRRRLFLTGTVAALLYATASRHAKSGEGRFEIERTNSEWREMLNEAQYLVLREEKAEKPLTSPLLHENRAGVVVCGCCSTSGPRSTASAAA